MGIISFSQMDMIYNSLHAIDDKLEIAVWLKGFHIAEVSVYFCGN